ncbi:MAG: cupin domain-containing protein [Candidatus Aenigmarchaeota archaeon]|nr:cupin domain-containing protein [Candidatus Aenigmarchaeota archaeon]
MAVNQVKIREGLTMEKDMKRLIKYPGDEIVVPCPCGESHRFFTVEDGGELGLHVTSICGAESHKHGTITELYYVLEGTGEIELDGERFEVYPGTVILIPPGFVHRGIGNFKVIVAYNHPELHQSDVVHV